MTDIPADRARADRRYGTAAIVLHWTIAAAIVFQVMLAWRMGGPMSPQAFALVQLHKSVGITILALSLVRLGWRLAHRPPPMPAGLAPWERWLARATHIGFYAVMIGMPLTGWIMVSSSRLQVPTLLYGTIPWPHIPGLGGASRKLWSDFGAGGHEVLAYGLYGLLALHVAGALKHQLFDRDAPVLARMAPGARPGRRLEPRLIAIALAVAAVAAAGWFIRPPAQGVAAPPSKAEAAEDADLEAPTPVVTPPAAPAPAAQPEPTAAPVAAAPVQPSRWTVGKGSSLEFETAWGDAQIRGRFARWTAEVLFAPEALDRSKVTVSIDMGSAESGDAQRDMALPAPDWFDAAAHPKATFTASRFEKTGEDRYVAHGRLTLRGQSRPVSLPFRLQIDGDTARVRGVTSLDRTAFGVGQGEWTSTDQIPAKVKVRVDLRATRR